MKRFLLRTVVFLLAFAIALLTAGKIMNRDNNSMTKEMADPTLPIIMMENADIAYNELHGMVGIADVVYQRDTMTVLGENRELNFQVDTYGTELQNIAIEVRSCDGQRLIENTNITEYTLDDDVISVQTSVKDLIEKDTEYALIVVLTDANDREIRYYTRILWSDAMYTAEKVQFVLDFHEATYDDEALNTLVKYMESNSKGNNTTLHKVDIHSSMSQLGWGELAVKQVTEPVVNLKEIASQTASLELNTIVSTGFGKNKDYYFVMEQYRIRYTTDRVYLLDFERTMTQIPDVNSEIYANDKIVLGIVAEDIPLLESEDGNIVVFEVANRLCSYNITSNKLALIFSFYDEATDARSVYDQHNIKILNVDEGGNVQFAVYGYMNRGRHEGEVGIQLYYYDSKMNTIEESIYIPYEKSYDILACEIEKLLYINPDGILYLYVNHRIYAVNTLEKTIEELAVMENDESIEISASHKIAVWYEKDDLILMDLAAQTQVRIKAKTGEKLFPLGFMEEDLIYGVAREEDISTDAVGRNEVLMYKVCICDANGNLLKEYEQENIYIVSCSIVDNQITLERVRRNANGDFVEITQDHIMNNVEIVEGKNKISVVAVDTYERIVQIDLKSTIDAKTIQILTPKEVVFEGARSTTLEAEEQESLYYVYNSEGVSGIYKNPATALSKAYETSGVVVDETGKTIWIKGNRVTKNQIMAIKEQSVTDEKNSLAVCLDTILKFEGITLNTEELLAEGNTALDILQENLVEAKVVDLTGCNLDTVLFFVNQDIPVLATLDSGEAVLVVGFNQYNIVVMEPSTGRLYKKGINDSTEWFEKNGNRFITYFRVDE